MKRALIYIGAAAACVAGGGAIIGRTMHLAYGHAVYCALGTAATVGCDRAAATGAARLASGAVIVVCIPLFALAYGSLSSAHLRKHMVLHRLAAVAQVKHEMDAAHIVLKSVIQESAREQRRALDRHAQNLLDRADTHAESLKQHVTAAVTRPPAPAAPAADGPPGTPPPPADGARPRRPGRNT